VGILNKIVRVISLKQKRNIRSITIDTREGTFDGEIALFVRDRADLEEIQTQLLDIKGLHGVTRILRN